MGVFFHDCTNFFIENRFKIRDFLLFLWLISKKRIIKFNYYAKERTFWNFALVKVSSFGTLYEKHISSPTVFTFSKKRLNSKKVWKENGKSSGEKLWLLFFFSHTKRSSVSESILLSFTNRIEIYLPRFHYIKLNTSWELQGIMYLYSRAFIM